jgi:predicted AAA+ superfamily ATPase
MVKMDYVRRTAELKVFRVLEAGLIALIVGPRQTGKTSLIKHLELEARQKGDLTLFVDGDFTNQWEYLLDTESLIARAQEAQRFGKHLWVFVDEIQRIDGGGVALKRAYDQTRQRLPVYFIATGSVFLWGRKGIGENLTGRAAEVLLLPFSLRELFEHTVGINLEKPKLSEQLRAFRGEIAKIWEKIVQFGAFPSVWSESDPENKKFLAENIAFGHIRRDMLSLVSRGDWTLFQNLLTVLATEGGIVNIAALSKELKCNRHTVQRYLDIAQELFVLRLVNNFSGSIRSELRRTPRPQFVDVGFMRALAKNWGNPSGFLVEQAIGAELWKAGVKFRYWRTKSGAEVDFIIGENIPVEVKSGYRGIHLSRGFKSFIDTYHPPMAFWLMPDANETFSYHGITIRVMPAEMFIGEIEVAPERFDTNL